MCSGSCRIRRAREAASGRAARRCRSRLRTAPKPARATRSSCSSAPRADRPARRARSPAGAREGTRVGGIDAGAHAKERHLEADRWRAGASSQPVRYHHSVRYAGCAPWSRGNSSGRGTTGWVLDFGARRGWRPARRLRAASAPADRHHQSSRTARTASIDTARRPAMTAVATAAIINARSSVRRSAASAPRSPWSSETIAD
jgi:hypothetical protein